MWQQVCIEALMQGVRLGLRCPQVEYTATSPNLLAAFIRVVTGESLQSTALATSQAFYVIRGTGSSESEFGVTEWAEGDLFVLPTTEKPVCDRPGEI